VASKVDGPRGCRESSTAQYCGPVGECGAREGAYREVTAKVCRPCLIRRSCVHTHHNPVRHAADGQTLLSAGPVAQLVAGAAGTGKYLVDSLKSVREIVS
jgi:hypothetical protein